MCREKKENNLKKVRLEGGQKGGVVSPINNYIPFMNLWTSVPVWSTTLPPVPPRLPTVYVLRWSYAVTLVALHFQDKNTYTLDTPIIYYSSTWYLKFLSNIFLQVYKKEDIKRHIKLLY